MGDCDACRRGLLKASLAGAAVLLVPGCGGGQNESPSADGGPDEAGDDATDEGDGACVPTCSVGSTTLTLTFAQHTALRKVGGSVVVSAKGYKDPSCGLDLVIVAQVSAGKYIALSAGCTHQCCTVGYDAALGEMLCPCHGSRYSTSGQVLLGPAEQALQKLSVCADECAVYVSIP
jgi:Rieske Fe-S protein